MTRKAALRRSGRRGSTFVEFALFFIVFLTLIVQIIELGRVVWTYTTLAHAVREGARYARLNGSDSPATDEQIVSVIEKAAVGLPDEALQVQIEWLPDRSRGSQVRITGNTEVALIGSSLALDQSKIPLETSSTGVVER